MEIVEIDLIETGKEIVSVDTEIEIGTMIIRGEIDIETGIPKIIIVYLPAKAPNTLLKTMGHTSQVIVIMTIIKDNAYMIPPPSTGNYAQP